MAIGLENLAGVASAQADVGKAIKLLGAAANLRQVIDVPLPAFDQPRYQHLLAAARVQQGETIIARAYTEGYAMTVDQAVAFALIPYEH